ncbi:HdeD family acid-resistance protein [Herbidospora daliensis]|uniref:HdeD family acid-resistance protein n=1 Tax=Herbidospora daliensis TaxID=295585 RepID=UPI0007837F7A|nr:HdeD family acid-resistance protein [Herbidospora daliensis]
MHDLNADLNTGLRPASRDTWWVLAVRGLLAVIFGIIALAWPGITLLALVYVFAAYAIVNGLFTIAGAFREVNKGSRGWMIFSGVVGVVVGIVVATWPAITAIVLLWLIGAWFVVTGLLEIIAAVNARRRIDGDWGLMLAGVLSVVFGVVLVIWPAAGALSLAWLIGVLAIILGLSLFYLAFRVKNMPA